MISDFKRYIVKDEQGNFFDNLGIQIPVQVIPCHKPASLICIINQGISPIPPPFLSHPYGQIDLTKQLLLPLKYKFKCCFLLLLPFLFLFSIAIFNYFILVLIYPIVLFLLLYRWIFLICLSKYHLLKEGKLCKERAIDDDKDNESKKRQRFNKE